MTQNSKLKTQSSKFKYTLLAICFATIIICGYKMYALDGAKKLWEWWTFPFLCALWCAIVLLFLKRYNMRRLLLSTLSGVLFVIGFPPHSFPPALFFAFVPLLMISDEGRRTKDDGKINSPSSVVRRPSSVFKYAFNAFVIFNIGVTWWVANAGLVAGLIANYLNAAFMATAFWLFHKLNERLTDFRFTGDRLIDDKLAEDKLADRKKNLRSVNLKSIIPAFIFISFWIGFEYLHLNWDISWTWLTLGNAFAENTFLIQWYELTGVFGGTLWILVGNYVIFKFLTRNVDTPKLNDTAGIFKPLSPILIFLFLSLCILTLGYARYKLQPYPEAGASVVVVQPNFEPHYEKFNYSEEMQLQKFLRLASEKVDATTDYLVFPETSFIFQNINVWNDRPAVQTLKKFVARYPKLHLITGVECLKTYAEFVNKKPDSLTASSIRTYKNPGGTFTFWEEYNAAMQISNDTNDLPLYKKSKFVPGPELLPYPQVFGFLIPLFEKMGGSANGLGAQTERGVFENKQLGLKIAPVICYESIFGDFCTGYVRNGADALFVVTNDGWWGNTPGYQQHLDFACLRSIELRRSVIRSANTGASCFINMNGDVSQMTKYGVDAVIKGNIIKRTQITFYAQHGDYLGKLFAYPAVLLLFLTIGLMVRRRLLKK